ncbi:MAG: ribonuclease III domain-containing protein, partial [Geobacteraceae bacterium]|nr:ribonuclease III domain-containing protein [Geobacteraceae bacterium]
MRKDREKLLENLESILGYQFSNRDLLVEALTHRSFVNESRGAVIRDNQRLEFFGDAVLGLLVSRRLLDRFPALGEGDLSRLRASLVDEPALAGIAETVLLGSFLLLVSGTKAAMASASSSLDTMEAQLLSLIA